MRVDVLIAVTTGMPSKIRRLVNRYIVTNILEEPACQHFSDRIFNLAMKEMAQILGEKMGPDIMNNEL
jgi:hypothetical protein